MAMNVREVCSVGTFCCFLSDDNVVKLLPPALLMLLDQYSHDTETGLLTILVRERFSVNVN